MILIDKLDTELSQLNPQSLSLQKLFQGSYEYKNKCKNCKTISYNLDYFQQLLLPIPTEALMNNHYDSFLDSEETKILSTRGYSLWNLLRHPISTKAHLNIYYCIQKFLENQIIEKFCPVCSKETLHSSKTKMKDFPEYLLVSLKRFKKSVWNTKVSDSVYLSKKLKFRKIDQGGEDTDYVLIGIIEHKGLAFRGHYRYYINHYGEWWLLDDKRVKKRTFEQIFRSQAYIALYVKREKWEVIMGKFRSEGFRTGDEFVFVKEAVSEGEFPDKDQVIDWDLSMSQDREIDDYDELSQSDD